MQGYSDSARLPRCAFLPDALQQHGTPCHRACLLREL